MCDEGRFGFHYCNADERFTAPLVHREEHCDRSYMPQALSAVAASWKRPHARPGGRGRRAVPVLTARRRSYWPSI